MANLFMMGNHSKANVSLAYHLWEDIWTIYHIFGKRSYIFWIEAIFQILFHFRDYIFLLFYIYIKCNINYISDKLHDA